ncbi:MAG: hypothetical protein HZC37_12845 [Burkholderiales bacterium]|nr:hypothetical protein [Burkholderiales bacterium]
MTSASDLTRLVPGFDFLQGLMKGGGAGLPSIGQWIAPTLEPAELQKRIDELRTVQFWLDQNSKLLGTTIQALEVQRMTLATLKGMNLHMTDLADSLKLRPAAAPEPAKMAPPAPPAAPGAPSASARSGAAGKAAAKAGAAKAAAGNGTAAVDPMQWWGALTQQFTELATKALQDGSAEMARNLAGSAAKQGAGAAETSIERMMAMSGKATELAVKTGAAVAKAAGSAAGSATGSAARPAAAPAAAARRRKT